MHRWILWALAYTIIGPSHAEVPLRFTLENRPSFTLTFTHPPRLKTAIEQAIQAANPTYPIFWAGAKVYRLSPHIQTEKQRIIARLQKQSGQLSPEKQHSVRYLIRMLQQLPNAQAIHSPIDWDGLSLGAQHNPKLPRSYRITLPSLPGSIAVVGALNDPIQRLWQAHRSPLDYLSHHETWHRLTNITLIQPTGEIQTVTLRHHRPSILHLGPGGLLFVPFQSTDFDKADQLNHDIIQLLKNRPL